MKIEIDVDTVNEVVTNSLKDSLEYLEQELAYRSSAAPWATDGIFDGDSETDLRKTKKMIRSLRRVLKYYGNFDNVPKSVDI